MANFRRTVTLSRLSEWLVALSGLYLGLPLLLFCAGWLRAPWNVVSVAALLAFFYFLRPRRIENSEPEEERVSITTIFWCFLPCALLLPLSGVGALAPQHGDWHKHNAILLDLIHRPFPVLYTIDSPDGGAFYLLYYLGYYLPAAALGRVFGENAAVWGLLSWTLLGLLLITTWIVFWTRGRAVWAGLAFLCFDGLKPLGYGIALVLDRLGAWNMAPFSPLDRQFQWWAGRPHFQYSSPWLALGIVPQHALCGSLAAALLAYAIFHPRARQAPFVLASTLPFSLFWSVFVGIASAIFTALALLLNRRDAAPIPAISASQSWQRAWPWVFSLSFTLGLATYYAGRIAIAPQQEFPVFPLLTWRNQPLLLANFSLRYALWTILEWGAPFWVALRLRAPLDGREKSLLSATIALLIALPLVQFGRYNDLLMRGIVPAQFLIFLLIINALRGAKLDGMPLPIENLRRFRAWRQVLIALLCLASLANFYSSARSQLRPLIGNWRALRAPEARNRSFLTRWQERNSQKTAGSLEPDFNARTNPDSYRLYRSQYLGREDSLWWRYLARQNTLETP